jgi:hypothetical protein
MGRATKTILCRNGHIRMVRYQVVEILTTPVASPHESHYDLVAAAIATAAATMLTLLTTLGSSNSSIESSNLLRALLEVELLVLEFALLVGVVALLQRNEARKRRFTFASASLLILGTILLWLSATIIIASA